MSLFPLEAAVLDALALEATPCAPLLAQQRAFLEVRERKSSPAGFFTWFTLRPRAPITTGINSRCGEVQARIPGLQTGMGFLLLVDAGRVTMLEGYTYGEEMPELSQLVQFALGAPARDEHRR